MAALAGSFGASTLGRRSMLYWFGMLFAIIGAAGILFALGFVTLVIGGLVNGMVALMSGPLIDRFVDRRERSVSRA